MYIGGEFFVNEIKKHPVDRRVRKTKQLLKQGLITLLMEKSIHKITIKELVELVDINRGTFYLHCKDLNDLLHQIEDEMMCELTSILEINNVDELRTQIYPFVLQLLKYIEDNADLCLLLLTKTDDRAFFNKLKKTIEKDCFDTFSQLYSHSNSFSYETFSAFAVSGAIGAIQLWLETGHKESVETVAEILTNILEHGISFFELSTS